LIHLREIVFDIPEQTNLVFPLNLPVLKNLSTLTFSSPVTFFVGENGSGKSTFLEALALSAGSIVIGSEDLDRDATLTNVHPLVERMKLIWNKRTHRGFFLRAEDFFGYVKRSRSVKQSLVEAAIKIEHEYRDRSEYAKTLAKGPVLSSVEAFNARYGGDLGERSHGESFLALFQARFVPEGLYLLDEPEAALSPISQLGLISLIKSMVAQGGQFIIATHSPILLAIPNSQRFNFDRSPPEPLEYDALDHVKLYRDFLDSPGAFIDKL
jgi:predicted ATPase